MRRLALLLVPAIAILLPATAAAAPTAPGRYVALGDSYAVGVGTYTYDDPNDACRRGPLAYSRLWAAAHPSTTYVEESCSGAEVADVVNQAAAGLTPDTSLVTVQVGGNDVGFVSVLETCILNLPDSTCTNAVTTAIDTGRSVLPGSLAGLYSGIRAKAPSAQVVVMGYPRMYKIGGNCLFGLSDTKRTALNNAADVLDGLIQTAAANAGFRFVDAPAVFTGHEICSGNSVWLTSLQWDKLNESYHPTANGHRGYYSALTAITG
ncbi:SGNH/GDSL hydrolase family protein [Kutzneria kofuensis]|uniref:Lysophospholipase L1-like esterase n=1 Tax=Kutzneria kofuensis TaxID=103725 RepID=A0A7W9KBF4_9PSEU|nr:SGNH/GDSL hydrolase family protein [Kutzneria kofuensis]MBB5889528.1 lysophospholipase L1-like esterase [Kutzneria kofuensis]